MVITTAVLSTSLASFNGNSNIDNNGNPNAKASNNSITCHRDQNSSFKTITNNSGGVCHSNINEMNSSTKVAVPSPKMTSEAEHLTVGSTSTKTTSIFGSIDNNIAGMAPTSAFVKPQQLEQPSCVSHEDVMSLAGASSLYSQHYKYYTMAKIPYRLFSELLKEYPEFWGGDGLDGTSNAGDRYTDLEKVEKNGAVLPSSVEKASILSFDKSGFSGMNVVEKSARSSLELAASLENILAAGKYDALTLTQHSYPNGNLGCACTSLSGYHKITCQG
uniref:Uncharacterized protein n=1 Tax=Glossina pallidipes TaxID=7398 RepID=A0A1A9ZTG9_GLOPL